MGEEAAQLQGVHEPGLFRVVMEHAALLGRYGEDQRLFRLVPGCFGRLVVRVGFQSLALNFV